jgi:hypothetical protein
MPGKKDKNMVLKMSRTMCPTPLCTALIFFSNLGSGNISIIRKMFSFVFFSAGSNTES